MVVVPKPAVKGCGAFCARGVDGAVGPAVSQGADEALCFPVCLGTVGTGAEVLDPELSAGKRVHYRDVGAAVVGEQLLDLDPVAAVEADGAAEEAGRGRRLLIGQHLRVGEAAVVVDGDVHVLPADRAPRLASLVGGGRVVVLRASADPPACSASDPAELLDIDVQQLTWPGALVADGRLEPEDRKS